MHNIWCNFKKLSQTEPRNSTVVLDSESSELQQAKTKQKNNLPTEEDWMLILNCANEFSFNKDDIIICEGDTFQRLYQIIKGFVRVERSVIPTAAAEDTKKPRAEKGELDLFIIILKSQNV